MRPLNENLPIMRLLVSCLFLGLPLAALSQNLDRLTPEPVPSQVEAPPTSAAAMLAETPEIGDRLIDQLKGIIVGPSPEAVAAVEAASGLTVVDAAWLDTPELREGLELFLNRPVDEGTLQSLPTALRLFVGTLGYPYSLVYLPEQDITEGVIRAVVVRSRLDSEIVIEGAKYFSAAEYRKILQLEPGALLPEQNLQADVAWINRNPFRAAALEARAGAEPGTTQLVLKVRETRPLRAFVSADNTGTETTKEERVTAGINWGNAFGLGHQLSAQWNSSWDFDTLRSVSGSYTMDLPWRHTLSVSGAYSVTNGFVAPPFALKGTSWQVGLNYAVPLESRKPGLTHGLRFGADFKSSDNNFTFASIPITDNLTHVAQFRATYSGNLTRAGSRTGFGVTVTAAPGGMTNRNEDIYFDISRSGSKAAYVYLRTNATHSVSLDGIKKGLSWSLRGELQLSPVNLIGSEQFGGGGAYSVRGYEQGEVFKDSGGLLSQELRLPAWTPRGGHRFQPYIFQDYAYLWSSDELPNEDAVELHSAGLGFDYSYGRNASVRAAYGWQFLDSGSSESGDNARLHLSANLSF